MIQQCIRALALLAGWSVSLAVAPSAPVTPAPVDWCAVSVQVAQLDPRYAALRFFGFAPAIVSATVALYAGDARYDVRVDRVAVSVFGANPSAMEGARAYAIVRFPADTRVDSAVVSSVQDPPVGVCSVPYYPWFATTPGARATGAGAPPSGSYIVDAPVPVHDPVPCAEPNAPAHKLGESPELWPPGKGRDFHARAVVGVTIDEAGNVAETRILASTADEQADAFALTTARETRWAPGRFRCRPDVGTYNYVVEFGE